LTPQNKKERLEWCEHRRHWKSHKWKLFICSDEAKASKGQSITLLVKIFN
jgi:hypothetical protein